MKMIQALYPKLKIVARGNVIKVLGDEEEMCALKRIYWLWKSIAPSIIH